MTIPQTDWCYDIETYLDLFCIDLTHIATRTRYIFEVSDRRDQSRELIGMLYQLRDARARMFGFNNVGFDWSVLQYLIGVAQQTGSFAPFDAHRKGDTIVTSQNGPGRWEHNVWPRDRLVTQGDLFLIHHFDNKARSTGLKKLQINMRSVNVVDLPYPSDQPTTSAQKDEIVAYMCHDVSETMRFYHASLDQIRFRDELAAKYPDMEDVLNFNDTKIGKKFFERELERNGTPCYTRVDGRRKPRQTPRASIALNDVISPRVAFRHPEFQRIEAFLRAQVLGTADIDETLAATERNDDDPIETKGVFKGLSATIDGFRYDFGTGGIHGSISAQTVRESDGVPCPYCGDGKLTGLPGNACENCMNTGWVDGDPGWEIWDWDVSSYYPNLAISNNYFPAHLSETFCDVYRGVYEMRKGYKKGTAENAMLKLALNGVYGDSNNRYGPFYDPQYTMSITVNGQLMLCMLAEWLRCDGLSMIQINTDGLTVRVRKDRIEWMKQVCALWEKHTALELESVRYSAMHIRDVNNYIAVKAKDGSVKRKGAYAYETFFDDVHTGELGWHKNHSALVVKRAAEAQMVHGVPVEDFIMAHRNPFDFMLSVKAPRAHRLFHGATQVQNTSRYYVSTDGAPLTKVMPPLKGKSDDRSIGVEKGWNVTLVNDATLFRWNNVNWVYYINEARKLCIA